MRTPWQHLPAAVLTVLFGLQACVKAEEKNERRLKAGAKATGSGSQDADGSDDEADTASDIAGSGSGKKATGSGSTATPVSGIGPGSGTDVAPGSEADPEADSGEIITEDDDDDDGTEEILADDSLTYLNFAKAVFDAKCVSCHTVPPTGGAGTGMRYDQWADAGAVKGVGSMLLEIEGRVSSDNMPPAGSIALTADEKTKILAWIKGTGGEGEVPDPSVSAVKPAKIGVAPAADVTVLEAGFANATTDALWNAYYTATRGATTGGTPIFTDRPVADKTFDWDTSAVPEGEWFIYYTIEQGAKTAKVASRGSVLVNRPTAGVNPVVSLNDLWNGLDDDARAFGFPITVGYTATDANAGDVVNVELSYKKESEATWTNVPAAELANKVWTPITAPADGITYRIRITATSDAGGKAIVESENVIGLSKHKYTFDGEDDDGNAATPPVSSIREAFKTTCAGSSCHNAGAGPAGKFVWDDFSATKGLNNVKDLVITRVIDSDNPMPPTLGATERASLRLQLRLWDWGGRNE